MVSPRGVNSPSPETSILTPCGQFISAWIGEVEARASGKREDLLGDCSAGISDLLLRRVQIVHIDNDQGTRSGRDRSPAKPAGYPAILEAGVVGAIVLEFPPEDPAVKMPDCRQVIGVEFH